MKKFFAAVISTLILSACGTGSYSVSSGKADECSLSFTSQKSVPVTIVVDGRSYDIKTVAERAWKTERRIRETAENTIVLTPGTHDVQVISSGQQVYSKKLFISTSEHKVVQL